MSTVDLLRANCEKLLAQYNSNVQAVVILQETLVYDILPSIVDELELSPEATEWAREWLEDTYTLFRISRRNNFTRSFAMESIRKNLVWRLSNLWPLVHSAPTALSMMHCLPKNVHDPFGRPLLIIDLHPLDVAVEDVKSVIVKTFERLRCHLKHLNSTSPTLPILQYIVLLDVKEFSLKYFDLDLFTWIIREVIPQFPGMLGGVFMLNSSWVHAGVWNVIKRALPQSALSRVFFPSKEDLFRYFTPDSLPEDYGGALPSLGLLDDPLQTQEIPSGELQGRPQAFDPPFVTHLTPTSISPTSLLNPFFGYPTSLAYGSLSLYHGRRRKRDLAKTLLLLFWIRWRKSLLLGFLFVVFVIALKMTSRSAQARHWKSLLARKLFLAFKPDSK